MTFHIITLFPRAFGSYLGESILKRAIEDKKIAVKFYDPRDYAENRWKRIDRAPYGGGPGMIIQALPVIKAVERAVKRCAPRGSGESKSRIRGKTVKIIWLSPGGRQFTSATAAALSKRGNLIIVCGRYEGIDARVKRVARAMGARLEEISLGPFVLTGGELPAMLMIDTIARQVPGVLGDAASLEEGRSASSEVYTRPEIFSYGGKRYRVPRVLLTGHHGRISEWRQARRRKDFC